MADSFSEDPADPPANPGGDIEMAEGAEEGSTNPETNGTELAVTNQDPDSDPPRTSFAQYLTSPVVTLIVGSGDTETILTAHQSLLTQSPFFAEACAEFEDDGSVGHNQSSTYPWRALPHPWLASSVGCANLRLSSSHGRLTSQTRKPMLSGVS